jgi:prophage tail gpP-like protein
MSSQVVSLKVGGLLFSGWKSLRAEVGIEQCAGAFELGVVDRWAGQDQPWPLKAGDACQLQINGQTVVTGYIDSVRPTFDRQSHGIQVSGRDRTMDLIDCAAIFKTGQWKKSKLDRIARDIATPFGIEVIVAEGADIGAAFDSYHIEEGERAFESIERAARMRAVLVTTDGTGRLILSTPSKAKVGVVLAQGVNVLSASLDISWKERFSEITIKGQGKGSASTFGDKVAHGIAKIKDEAITRYRPLVVIAEQHGLSPTFAARAEWERNVRAGRGTRATVKVQGWTYPTDSAASGEKVWKPNQLVAVDLPYLGLQEDLLIAKCSYSLDESGSFTELHLAHPSAFQLLAGIKGTRLDQKIKGRNGVENNRVAKERARGKRGANIEARTGLAIEDDEQ